MIAIKAPQIQYVSHRSARLHDGPMLYGNQVDWRGQSTKRGPAIGVVGAIGSISAGLSAGGLLGGVLIAGGVLGGIGALTGNKTLMAIGSISALAGGFISADTGAFFNPFGEGAGQSILGKGLGDTFGSVFDKIKSTLGVTPTSDLNPAGSLASKLAGSSADVATETTKQLAGGAVSDLIPAATRSAAAEAAKATGGGILGSIFSTPGVGATVAGAASGAAQGLLGMGLQDAQQQNYEANAAYTDAKTASENQNQQLIAQRQQNLQFQNTGNLPTANTAAQLYAQSPGTAQARVPVTMPDGSVQMVTVEQYAQMKQNGG